MLFVASIPEFAVIFEKEPTELVPEPATENDAPVGLVKEIPLPDA